jgi:DNA polymerase/3'-5' exonuclease PolX
MKTKIPYSHAFRLANRVKEILTQFCQKIEIAGSVRRQKPEIGDIEQADDFYRQLAIRTGSAEYSRFIIAVGWRKKGWVGSEEGLILESEATMKNGKYKLSVPAHQRTLPPVWQSEEEFFNWLGVPCLQPERREI